VAVMPKDLIISVTSLETKAAILEDDLLVELYIERAKNRGILGNIYKGRVTKVLPGMQSAFVNIGLDKDAFLYVTDFFEETDEYEKIFTIDEKVTNMTPASVAPAQSSMPEERRRPPRYEKRRRERYPPPTEVITKVTEQINQNRAPIETLTPDVAEMVQIWQLEHSKEQLLGENGLRENREAGEPVSLDENREAAVRASEDGKPFVNHSSNRDGSYRDRGRHKRNFGRKRPPMRNNAEKYKPVEKPQSIETLLREGQEIMVQVAKEPIGKKGARVTSHIALPGRYLVYMPTVDHIGVSRKISSEAERMRLKDVVLRYKNNCSGGFIVRTAGEGQSETSLQADMKYLVNMWDEIKGRFERTSAPTMIHSEIDLIERILRDQLSTGFGTIRIDDENVYARILDFVNRFQPALVPKIKLYTKDRPIFEEYGIMAEMEKALQPKVWLKSGGYIVINQTEALVAIDINTGKFVGKSDSLEDTITNTNLEALQEIVRQIRLRDLGGIIVIDFIDMEERKNRKRVMEALEQEVRKDKSPTKILEFNEFGLVAITRKRVKQSLERTICQTCPYCVGAGFVRSVTTTCYAIHDEVRKMAKHLDGEEVTLRVNPEVARTLRENQSIVLEEIRHITGKEVTVRPDPLLHISQFDIIN
jgi:ribonuclease G